MNMTRINMDYVANRLNSRGIRAVVEQTGGGVATIQAGKVWTDSDGDLRYEVLAGPGRFGWGKPSFGDSADFYVGPDDDGETPVRSVEDVLPGTVTDEAVAELIALQCTGGTGQRGQSRRRWGRRKR